MTSQSIPELPGLPLERVRPWLEANLPGGCGPITASQIAGGRSNLTFALDGGARRWVLRRPPVGDYLPTAHDVAREYRVMAALQGTEVPVPRTDALCTDPDVVGAPFYVMGLVEGATYRNVADLEPLGPARTRALSGRLMDTLAQVHQVDLAATGLADLGRPEGFVGRQVNRWFRQIEASDSPYLDLATRLHARLAAAVPVEGHVGLVHGDFRIDNVLVSDDDRPVAVIDWEMATVGDTLTDLALMVVYQRTARQVSGELMPNASLAPGYLSEEEMVERYRAAVDHEVRDVEFHLALASFKLAGIIAGIDLRYRKGQLTGDGVDEVGAVVEPLLLSGLEHV